MFFANEQRDTVREENPGISFGKLLSMSYTRSILMPMLGQVGKVLGDKWKALSDKQREPYEKKAAADKKRYEDEKAKYNVSPSPRKSRSPSDCGRPPAAMTTRSRWLSPTLSDCGLIRTVAIL